ncbi:MAG: hypothetical protein ACI4DP_00150 [Candidatus Ornithomonoglobus sp.]
MNNYRIVVLLSLALIPTVLCSCGNTDSAPIATEMISETPPEAPASTPTVMPTEIPTALTVTQAPPEYDDYVYQPDDEFPDNYDDLYRYCEDLRYYYDELQEENWRLIDEIDELEDRIDDLESYLWHEEHNKDDYYDEDDSDDYEYYWK